MNPTPVLRAALLVSALSILAGCLTFPSAEARAKARDLRERGYPSDADRLEERAQDLPDRAVTVGPNEFDPRNDPYHYPELQVPEEKRRVPVPKLNRNAMPLSEKEDKKKPSIDSKPRKWEWVEVVLQVVLCSVFF